MALRRPLEAHFEHFQSGNDVNMHRICFLRYGTKWKSKKYLLAMWPVSFSMVLQTLQLFNSLHFAMLCAMQSILEQSKRGLANPTVSQLFNSLYFNVFAAMQGTPEHTNRRIANPTVVQFSAFYHALCDAKHSRAEQKGPCKPYSQLFNFMYFSMLSAMQGIPEHSQRGLTNPTVSQLFNSRYCTMLSAMQGMPEHSQKGFAKPTVSC